LVIDGICEHSTKLIIHDTQTARVPTLGNDQVAAVSVINHTARRAFKWVLGLSAVVVVQVSLECFDFSSDLINANYHVVQLSIVDQRVECLHLGT